MAFPRKTLSSTQLLARFVSEVVKNSKKKQDSYDIVDFVQDIQSL